MKTGLVLLLILDVFKSARTELRHHQQQGRFAKENITIFSWSTTTQNKFNEDKKVTETFNTRQQWLVTSPEDFKESSKALQKFGGKSRKHLDEFNQSHPTKAGYEAGSLSKIEKNQKETYFSRGKLLEKTVDKENEFSSKADKLSKNFEVNTTSFHFLNPAYGEKRKTAEISATRSAEIDTPHSHLGDSNSEHDESLNHYTEISNFHFAEPLVALTVTDSPDGCVQDILDGFSVSDSVVSEEILADRNVAGKLSVALAENNGSMDEITDIIEMKMEKHLRITSISVTALKRKEKSKMSLTLYRRGNDLLIDRRALGYSELWGEGKTFWTPLFRNCLTKSWIFGYFFLTENSDKRVEVTVYFTANNIIGSVNQCKSSFRQILNGGPKCDSKTTECLPIPNSGFQIGGYKCICREGHFVPHNFQLKDGYYDGFEAEKNFVDRNSSQFRCLPCPDACLGSCTASGFCTFQRSSFLRNSILSVQIFCVLMTVAFVVLVFRHRKCKTIATGMWTIMEMILLGIIILYSTIIIRAFSPTTLLCLIEPWCREIGFVLCYGAIILKLYRIMIEFRTRKAHRWVVRDKDLLKYLFGMIIVVFGYMSAWTATNLYLMQKENYSLLTTGVTDDGVHFSTCKAIWWDYVTETSEILILIFGIHLSYASRNATTQFRERCFLCISISVEALISGIFYMLKVFYWETSVHPDFTFVSYFTRCQLTTTVVLFFLLIPKWWYQKIQNNKGRVSRNYLMQESGRGPFEAFKSQDGVTATNSDVEGEISLADMNPEDIRAELKRLYTQLEVLKNKTIRFDNPHISKRRGGRKIAHRRFSLQKKGSREKALRQQTQRLSSKHMDIEVTEAEASRTPEDSVCSNEGPSIIINDGPSDIVHMTPKKSQK